MEQRNGNPGKAKRKVTFAPEENTDRRLQEAKHRRYNDDVGGSKNGGRYLGEGEEQMTGEEFEARQQREQQEGEMQNSDNWKAKYKEKGWDPERYGKKAPKHVGRLTNVEGEEDSTTDQFNDLGETVTPFNLKEENEEGFYDKEGNYVWNKDDKEMQEDFWLKDVSEDNMKAAAAAVKRQAEAFRRGDEEVTDNLEARRTLLRIMRPGETVLQALRRTGGSAGQKRKRPTAKQEGKKDNGKAMDGPDAEGKRQFEELTEAADNLLHNGVVTIYQDTYEEIRADIRQEERERGLAPQLAARSSSGPAPAPTEPARSIPPTRWEYKATDGQVYGPYTATEMIQWRQQGYFTGPSAVMVRRYEEAKPASSQLGADEMMADFDDDEEETKEEQAPSSAWVSSDEVDFYAE